MPRDQLSDNWRRTICRCAFLLFCVLPTLLTGYWIFHPQTAGDWENTLRAELGLVAHIDSIETPGPNVTILRGVKLTDPLSDEHFITTQLRVIRGNPNRIVVDYPTTVSCQAFVQLVTKASENLAGSNIQGFSWRLEFADTATISRHNEFGPSIVTTGLTIDFNQYLNGPAAEIKFQLKDDPTRNIIHGHMHRGLEMPPQFGLNTGERFLPCWLLTNIVPDLQQLGPDCQFEGTLSIESSQQDSDQLVSEINGAFRQIDLANIVAPYEKELTGECTATVEQLIIKDGQFYSLKKAEIGCNRGEVGLQLLVSANRNLGFEIPRSVQANMDNSRLEFRNLDLIFKLENGRLSFLGNHDGVIAYDAFGNDLVRCFSPETIALENLAMFLVQPNAGDERLTEKMLHVLKRFHRPTLSLGSGVEIRVAERNDASKY